MIEIPLRPMTDSESLYAIRLGLVYMALVQLVMFFYFAFAVPFGRWLKKRLDKWEEKPDAK